MAYIVEAGDSHRVVLVEARENGDTVWSIHRELAIRWLTKDAAAQYTRTRFIEFDDGSMLVETYPRIIEINEVP